MSARIIIDLTRSVVNNHKKVYFDNYLSSLPLMRQLKSKKVYACGTMRAKRMAIPNDFKTDRDEKRGNRFADY